MIMTPYTPKEEILMLKSEVYYIMTSQIPTSLSVYFSREDVTLDTEKKPTERQEHNKRK